MASDTAPDTAPNTAHDTAPPTAPERDTGRAQVDPIPATVRCHEDADGIVVWLPADDEDERPEPDRPQVDQG
jgi:hypothetical protein